METNLLNTASIQAQHHRIRSSASKVGRFILHLLEMLLAMVAGMFILSFLGDLIPAYSSLYFAFRSGTNLYELAMVVFMTVPMVAWMIVRGHGRWHGAEMAFAMFVPVAVIIVLRQV
jgi:ABC-type multidrug transport system fused ATPase/permease subunit